MKVRNADRESAGILFVVIAICGIVGASLVGYLGMVSSQERFVHRSAVWNSCIAMCESGIEEALAHINHRDTGSNFNINGWSPATAGAFRKSQFLNRGRCDMAISTNYPPIITVTSKFPGPLGMGEIKRTVRVETTVKPPFPQLILSKSRVTLGGNGKIDSFNSTNTLESTNGQYSPSLATDRAIIASLTRNLTDFSIGNVDIWGYIAHGPGAQVSVNANGIAGSKLFCAISTNYGTIQPERRRGDFNVYIPDAALPRDFVGFGLGGPVTNAGTVYKYVAGEGDYIIPLNFTIANGEALLVTGAARIHALRDVTVSGEIN
jgi:hypothetical protein